MLDSVCVTAESPSFSSVSSPGSLSVPSSRRLVSSWKHPSTRSPTLGGAPLLRVSYRIFCWTLASTPHLDCTTINHSFIHFIPNWSITCIPRTWFWNISSDLTRLQREQTPIDAKTLWWKDSPACVPCWTAPGDSGTLPLRRCSSPHLDTFCPLWNPPGGTVSV